MVATEVRTSPRRPRTPHRAGARRMAAFPLRPPVPVSRRARRRRRLVAGVVRGAFFLGLLHVLVMQVSVVRGHSMEPSLHDGDRLLVDRLGGRLVGVDRFDVVVLRSPVDPSVDYVKRIVGLPGDRVAIRRGRLLVNGRPVRAGFSWIPDGTHMPEVRVPSGHYFVLGDNRPISCDSREFGFVAAESLRGVVRLRFWPPERAGWLN